MSSEETGSRVGGLGSSKGKWPKDQMAKWEKATNTGLHPWAEDRAVAQFVVTFLERMSETSGNPEAD